MRCGKCGEKIDTQYGYIRTNGNVYHNGVCPSSLPTVGAYNESSVIMGEFPSGSYNMILSSEYKQLKDTIEAQRKEIQFLRDENTVLKVKLASVKQALQGVEG